MDRLRSLNCFVVGIGGRSNDGRRRIVQVILRFNLDDGLGSILIIVVLVVVECFDQDIREKSGNQFWYWKLAIIRNLH